MDHHIWFNLHFNTLYIVKNNKRTYRVGLKSSVNTTFVIETLACSLQDAVKEWARITGHNDSLFDEKNMTYFGMSIVQTKKKILQRKENFNPFIR